ncbi:unnamed protein product [Tuber melanosporum]|uniref:HECT-type E3 ubiquitin transferase n=1 Tax=Tuber melanosporum (strain Mel28) TaxID=656061 RepID=D5G4Z8_TUBMM|nr:uncharacterized protein GSTUM_00000174001 [Tuber melanosporum]CAZ79591.1 unnamed protein product [Tuber melanosporum]
MKIKKTATAKHEATLSPFLKSFITTATSIPIPELLPFLSKFPAHWPFPRGDLYHWIALLNRFDSILEEQVQKYKLKEGPQTILWERQDEELVIGVLKFSRMLVENCGNRSLYGSSGFINDLLNTTSLDVLEASLRLGSRLAQRYHTSRTRGASQSTNAVLLASHYNINLERVSKLATPFLKSIAVTSLASGKNVSTKAVVPIYANDLARLARDERPIDKWGGAYVSYYVSPTTQKAVTVPGPGAGFVIKEPATPTPTRRTSLHHGHQTSGSAHNRRRSTDDTITDSSDLAVTGGMQTLEIPYSQIKAAPNLEDILKSTLPETPADTHYDLLHRLRVASALAGTAETRRQILGIRILALTNLAYVYSENQFTTKILQPDQDEPRRFQLVYQLAELVHSGDIKGASGDGKEIPRWLQTLALGGLEALARHKSKTADVCAALSVNVNHGVLLYVVRKAVEELAIEKDEEECDKEAEEWREALFTLVGYLPTTAHAGSLLVSAGLIPILVELLQLRTKKALRNIPKAVSFLDSLIYNVQNAFQALASAKGLDVVVDLVSDEVKAGLEEAGTGKGIPDEYKSSTTDFKIGFYRQQTLKMVFKFMQHMMAQSGGNADRLLRNLIDSPKLLSALKVVIENGTIWGSNIWSTVVGIVSAFIHNEPTSYAVIHEAGLSHALLETVTGRSGLAEEEAKRKKDEEGREVVGDNASLAASADDKEDESPEDRKRDLPPRLHTPATGIMPSIDSIGSIPTAFGAICLNSSGLALFQTSGALETFFEIFESADHVKCLTEHELASVLGSQFDELVRHHPVLRENVMKVVIEMLQRVEILGRKFAEEKGMGAKLWIEDGYGGMVVAGGRKSLIGRIHKHSSEAGVGSSTKSQGNDGEDVEMGDADAVVSTAEDADRNQPSIVNFIDAAGRFLEGFLANANLSKDFIKREGLDFLLDFYTVPSLPYDFATSQANQMMSRVLQVCSENSPSVTVAATLRHAQKAIDQLQPLLRHDKKEAFFAPLTDQKAAVLPPRFQGGLSQDVRSGGTKLIKDLVTVHSLCYLLQELYGQPLFNVRLTLSIFMEPENEAIVSNLGALHRMCVWEEILLQNTIPDTWNEATRVKNSAGAAAASIEEEAVPAVVATSAEGQLQNPRSQDEQKEAEKAVVERDGKTPWFRNVKTIRFLISQIPSSITPFLQGLARSLISRRSTDLFHKQHAFKIAEAISESMYDHLTWKRLDSSDSVTDKYGYWIRSSYHHNSETFWGEVRDLPALGDAEQIGKDSHQRMAHAYGGIKIILSLFTHLVSNKSVLDSSQTVALQTRERSSDTPRPDFFNPHQFLVELRASILPVVRDMWDASSIEKASCSIVKSVIEILGIVLKADSEGSAFTRKELEKKGRLSNTISWRTMEPNEEGIRQLVEMGFTRENAMAGLLRGNGNVNTATEWLTSQGVRTPQRGSQISASSSRPLTAESHSTDEEGTDVDAAREEPIIPAQSEGAVGGATPATEPIMPPPAPPAPAVDTGVPPVDDGVVAMNIDESNVQTTPPLGEPQASESAEIPPSTVEKGKAREDEKVELPAVVTIEDLDELRSTIRESLIDRSLDVLRVHSTVTFELSSLLTSAFGKASESPDVRKEVASTILQSLMSLQADDDLRPCAKTITSTSHLLGLVLQNQDFFDACLEDLKEQIPTLIGFIKMNKGEPAPWIASILLVVEKVLSESAQPRRVTFSSPPSDQEPENIAELNSYKISDGDQAALFKAVMGVVSVIGRDEILPLAVARVLVLLTRKRELAIRMTEGDNLRSLFHMLRCQAGLRTERIQASIMLVLRHIIEDTGVLKAIMRNEIRTWFQSRGTRQTDTQAFVRHNHHLVLRDPDAFVELVNELCKLTRYDPHLRNQQIAIKETERPKSESESKPEAESDPAKETGESQAKGAEDKEMVDKPKPAVEVKPPGLENPDGVIHFLLSELLASKDEMDNPFPPNPPKEDITSAPMDVQMEQGESTGKPAETLQANSPSKPEKPEFKAEQHPIFIYRCFILQALTELLSCYNRAKVEFIGFSRKAAPREAITPSKPRSAVLNYLLNDIIPLGTLIHTEDIAYKKRATTSQWAILAIVSLSAQTGESSSTADESSLLFVRKFILESALKAFKDASSSVEPLDAKYSRMMSLTDLFFRMLSARPNHNHSTSGTPSEKSQQQIARIMFEKNFIAALTGSLADIDLNFPSARRVIKYILRPLKLLSKTATDLNEISSITAPGATDEDEISTATSISDIGDMREDTPDLYRNSTLGMFEGEMVDEHSSYDEDDYDDEMDDDEMELEEEMEEEGDSEISDEEDEEGGEGMDVEIVVEAEQENEMAQDQAVRVRRTRGMKYCPTMVLKQLFALPEDLMAHRNLATKIEMMEEAMIQEDYEDDEGAFSAVPWGWADETGEAPMMARAHPRGHGGWYTLGGPPRESPVFMSNAARPRHYMGGTAPRTTDNVDQNPLLQQNSNNEQASARPTHNRSQEFMTDWVQAIDGMHAAGGPGGTVSMISTLMSLMTRTGQPVPVISNGGSIQFQALPHIAHHHHHHHPHAAPFMPRELRSMFEAARPLPDMPRHHREDPQTAVNSFIPTLTTGRWTEESRLLFGTSAPDRAHKVVNAILVLLVPPAIEEERITKEKQEKARGSEVPDGENSPREGEAMEGVEATQGEAAAGLEAGPSDPPAPRATVMIRGREMDITGMDIDPGFLEALPEELREEVLTQHIRERRAAAATNDQPSEISREFLEALPDEIRDELLAQEAADRRQANQLRGERRFNQFVEMPRVARVSGVRHPGEPEPKPVKKPLRKSVIQLLDKAGVATLLRLMFIPQVGSTRITLHEILLNICENRQNRAEVVNLLLSILQDGSSDMAAVERSFAQLSVRAKQAPATKTPTAVVKRTGTGLLAQTSSEVSPLLVAQQCLGALLFLVSYNEHIPSYFLNEHDISVGLKRSTSRKGKGKEVPPPKASKYALNTLLSLLDRRLITESSTVMDQLSVENKDEASNSNRNKDDDRRRRLRHLVPPVVPEHNLRLVVNILTARECSSKTFRETLATMQNLSAIPEAKVVFGAELIRQAQVLGGTILEHLEVLVHQIKHAENGTEIQGMALSNFSPASSDQAKLLRVLTALDYLFDPKRPSRETVKDGEPKDEESKKERDVLSNLYESLTFGPLWSKLSQCLSAIHERNDMLHVATILLPLIEALMVVCKNSGLKEAPRTQRGQTPMSPAMAETSMENLFFKFTEDHRKILNQMVLNNPKLMSGSFALLVHNPKVLEFDNKRNYFNRRLHTRQGNRDPHPTLQLNVRRDQVFLDSYKSMYYKNGDEIKYAKLSIRFHGEEGVDAGGVTREWFQVMARQMFNPDYALFIPVASDRTTFHPSRMSGVNPEHLSFFKFIGRIIGKALYEGRVLDCHFSRAVYKRILGKSVSLKDMETLDLDYYKSLVWMLENDITDIITETFSVETDDFGDKKIIDLVPDGRNVPVTDDNKHEYVRLLVEYRLLTSVQEQMENFLVGFHDIVPAELISIFNEQELELLISGLPEIDVDDWRNNTEYHNYSASSPQIQWFWRAVRSFDKEERAKLLQFVTGTSKVPLNGFKELEGMNGFSKFNIHRDYGSKDRLPSSHTCFNQIDLPEYESYESLRQNILTAITQGAEYFGFA